MSKIRTIQIPVVDEEYEMLLKLRGVKLWRDWLLEVVKEHEGIKRNRKQVSPTE